MKDLVVYVHGKGGDAEESEHYRPLFPDDEVVGLVYRASTPWEAGKEIHDAVVKLKGGRKDLILIANSVGAFFCMNAEIEELIRKAYFVSPIVDMEKLIRDMMAWAGTTEEELQRKGTIPTESGDDLSWVYLCYVRRRPVKWDVSTEILYGRQDRLVSFETIEAFVKKTRAGLTVMNDGEHWFHTEEQTRFLDDWIRNKQRDA